MQFLTDNMLAIGGGLLFVCLVTIGLLFRRRHDSKGATIGLQHIVTLSSGGWRVLAIIAALGAFVMIGSSAAIGVDYWTGLAIDADMTAGKIKPNDAGDFSFFDFLTVGVVSFFVLAIFFELMSDLGTPLSSGFRQRNNKALANFVLVACVGCIFMSLITKWGFYDDKTNVRRVEAAQTMVDDSIWHERKAEAEAAIERLKEVPSKAVADAKAEALEARIETYENQLDDAERARDTIPVGHSTNRVAAGKAVTAASEALASAIAERAAIVQMREDRAALDAAREALDEANTKIKANAGQAGSTESAGRQKAGDWVGVRVFRVGLHQFLCWLFPLVYFESMTAYRDEKKKEEANAKRRKTVEEKMNTVDAEFREVTEPKAVTANGYYREKMKEEAEEKEDMKRKRAKPEPPVQPGYRNGDEEGDAGEDEEASS